MSNMTFNPILVLFSLVLEILTEPKTFTFNPILVLFSLFIRLTFIIPFMRFQSYIGSIFSNTEALYLTVMNDFQSYIGSIFSCLICRWYNATLQSFNPILVLFSQLVLHCKFSAAWIFQSYIGSIFSPSKKSRRSKKWSFNPILVLFSLFYYDIFYYFFTHLSILYWFYFLYGTD